MEWTKKLSVGIDRIDNQHKELFSRINDLVTAIKKSVCKEKIGEVIQFLDDYVVFHFREEEGYMDKYSYPEIAQHKAQHKIFLSNLQKLRDRVPALEGGKKPGSYDLSVETNQVVVDWILEHIAETDIKLGKFLQGKMQNG